jgi:hypothetical protein
LIGLVGLLILFFATMPMARRRHLWLARRRGRIDAAGFEREMAVVGVTATTARFLWKDLAAFYHPPLKPLPDDRLEAMILVDRPEIEAMVMRFWTAMRGSDPHPAVSPLGPDPSVAELGRYLDLLAGWSLRGAA